MIRILLIKELKEFKKFRTDALSRMFDGVDSIGIYPTTKFYEELDQERSAHDQRLIEMFVDKISETKTPIDEPKLPEEVKYKYGYESAVGDIVQALKEQLK